MLVWAYIFLIIASIAAVFSFKRTGTLTNHLAKLLFYFSLFIFVALLFGTIFSSTPPPTTTSPLPI